MTINSTINKNQYISDGIITSYYYTFRILDANAIKVVITDPLIGISITLNPGSDYTVSGVGDAGGGQVNLAIAPLNMYRVTIVRAAPLLQPVHYVENDPFPAASHEIALDRSVTISQTLDEKLDRSISVGYGTPIGFDTELRAISLMDAGSGIIVRDDLLGFTYSDGKIIVGPRGGSTNNSIPRWDGVEGNKLKDSLAILSDSGNLLVPGIEAMDIKTITLSATDTITTSKLVASNSITSPLAAVDALVADTIDVKDLRAINATVTGTGAINELSATNLTVAGVSELNDLNVAGNTNLNDLNLDNIEVNTIGVIPHSGTTGQITFFDETGTQYVAFRANSLLSSVIYNLPTSDGLSGQVLATDGAGNLYWTTGGRGPTPPTPIPGTLAALSDVSFTTLMSGNVFTRSASRWNNTSPGVYTQPYSSNISLKNMLESRAASINMNKNIFKRANVKHKSELVLPITSAAMTYIDPREANVFVLTHNTNTTIIFDTPATSYASFTFIRKKDSSSTPATITWASNINWTMGNTPALTNLPNAIDSFFFRTIDSGASWFGYPAGLDIENTPPAPPPPPPASGTLASLTDVNFTTLNAGDLFESADGSKFGNIGTGLYTNSYNANTSLTNTNETRTQAISMNGSRFKRARIKAKSEIVSAIASSIDTTIANVFTLLQSTDTTLSFSTPLTNYASFTLIRTKDSSTNPYAITWPASVKWVNGTAPSLTQNASARDTFFFRTINNGLTWLGYASAINLI